jgi:hypothetical protein
MATYWLRRRSFRSARPSAVNAAKLGCMQLEARDVPTAVAAALFAPGTSQAYAQHVRDAFANISWPSNPSGSGPEAFQLFSQRLTRTATNGAGLLQGDPTTVTWGFVREGTQLVGDPSIPEATSPSILISRLDAFFGSGSGGTDLTQRPWFHLFKDSFDRWSSVTGLTFVYEPKDDGAVFASVNSPGSPGQLGVRADLRIGGHPIDGPGGILAFDYLPNTTDMVIDTDELVAGGGFDDPGFTAVLNVFMHETGHGFGLEHEEPEINAALMEPFLSTNFKGPQFDDILGAQRWYGDALEKNGGNDTVATATPLGAVPANGTIVLGKDGNTSTQFVSPTQTDFVSIDGRSDTDVYKFTLLPQTQLSLTVQPVGPTYLSGAEGGPPPTTFNASKQNLLKLELLDSTGTVVQTATASGLGASASILNVISGSGGTYYARITGSLDRVQMYQLTIGGQQSLVNTTITRDPSQQSPTNHAPIRFDVTFSSPVSGFTAGDVNFSPGTINTGLTATVTPNGPGGDKYIVTVTGMSTSGTVGIAIPDGAAVSTLNGGLTLGATTAPSDLVTFDPVPPTPVFTPSNIGLTSSPRITVTVNFGEPVTPLGAALPTVNATIENFNLIDPATYTFDLVPITQGVFSVTIPTAAVSDLAGNPSIAATLSGNLDNTAPTATITPISPVNLNLAGLPAVFRLAVDEALSPASVAALASKLVYTGSTVGGTLTATVVPDVAPNTYRISVSGITGTGKIRVTLPAGSVTDVAGNPLASDVVSAPDVFFDGIPPTASVTTTTPLPTNASSIPVTVVFSDPVPTFSAAALQVTGPATVVGFTSDGSGLTFHFTLSRTADGAFTVTVPAGVVSDPAGNPNAAATLSGAFDTTKPLPVVTAQSPAFTDTPAVFTVTFPEPVVGAFTASSVVIGGTARPKAATVTPGAAPNTFVVTVTGMIRDGTVTVQVPAGVVSDLAGNPSDASAVGTADFTTTNPPLVALVGTREFGVGADAGGSPAVQFFNPDGTARYNTTAFAGAFAGGVRTAAADFDGDGIADLVVGSGPGEPALVRVLSGRDGSELLRVAPFESSFTGGVFVAAGDLTGDGVPDLVVCPDEGGGPRVQVYRGLDFTKVADFFGINDLTFRGGARVAIGDLNGDGRADLLVAAGFGGGPRVAGYDGTTIGSRVPQHLFHDFFVFEQSLRNGVYLAVGDLNGDGVGDLVLGGGPGGAPRVMVLSGADLVAGQGVRSQMLANFFAGDINNRGGVRVAVKNLDDDGLADLVVGDGAGAGTRVTAYFGKDFVGGSAPAAFSFDAFAGSTSGVFVG